MDTPTKVSKTRLTKPLVLACYAEDHAALAELATMATMQAGKKVSKSALIRSLIRAARAAQTDIPGAFPESRL